MHARTHRLASVLIRCSLPRNTEAPSHRGHASHGLCPCYPGRARGWLPVSIGALRAPGEFLGVSVPRWYVGMKSASALVVALALVVAPLAGCRPTTPPAVNEVVALGAGSLPSDPLDTAWQQAPDQLATVSQPAD